MLVTDAGDTNINLQVEPYLYLGMGQVCLYHEAPEKIFSSGVDFKRYKDTWPMDLLSL